MNKQAKISIGIIILMNLFLVIIYVISVPAWVDNGNLNQNVSGCGVLNTSNAVYTQNQTITPTISGVCINITAENITYNGNGYSINQSTGYDAIYSSQLNTTIKNCNLTGSGSAYGIYLSGADNFYVYNNTITTRGNGIRLDSVSVTLIENNTQSGSSNIGINLISSNNNIIRGNSVTNNYDYDSSGIKLDGGSNNNSITNNTLHSNGNEEIGITGDNNTITNNNLWNCSVYTSVQNCITVTGNNNVFDSNKINKSAGGGITITGNNSLFKNTNMTNISGTSVTLYLGINNTFLNFSYFNESVSTTSELIRKWYYRAYVNDTSNNNIGGANVTAFNRTNAYNFNLTTDATGYTPTTEIIDYVNNGTKNYYSNYNITAFNNSYFLNSHAYNATLQQSNYKDVFTLELIPDTEYPIFSNYWDTNGTLVNSGIGNFNVTITSTNGTVFLEINNTNVTATNLTASVYNASYSFTSNGTYTYRWHSWGNGSSRNYNKSNERYYTVNTSIIFLSSCENLTYANTTYHLNNNVTSTATCFNIQANNITLDCRGYEINYSSAGILGYGVYSEYNYSTIKNCKIKEGREATQNKYAIYFSGASNGTIENNTIITSGAFGFAIYLELGSNSNTISDNTIATSGDSGLGIYLQVSSNSNTLSSNIIATSNTDSYGILLDNSNSNNFSNNNITTSGVSSWGISLSSSSTNTLSSNIITTSNTGSYGILLDSDINNSSFSGMNIKTDGSFGYAFYIYGVNNNITIKDSILNSSYAGVQEVYIRNAVTGGTWNFTNVTRADGSRINISWTAGANGTLNMMWYFNSNVNNKANQPVENANVSIFNISNNNIFSALTAASGSITRQEVIEYQNINGTKYYQTPHIFKVTKTGFRTNLTTYNLTQTQNIFHNVTLLTDLQISIKNPLSESYNNNVSINLNFTIVNYTTLSRCWFYILNSSNGFEKSNTTITNCQNTTFDISRSDTYALHLWVNETNNERANDSVVFKISLESPAIVLNSPNEEAYLNYTKSIYFNFTATDSDGLSSCELWGNWTDIWHKNYTWINPTNATMNYTILNLSDGKFVWDVQCNDTSNNFAWAISNRTFSLDTINPSVKINSITTTTGSQIITFNSTVKDNNLDSCKYSIFQSDGDVDCPTVCTQNLSFNCNTLKSTIVSDYGAYNLTVYVNDTLGHENSSTSSFTVVQSAGPGGGGGGEPLQKQKVVAIIKPSEITKVYSDLQRAILYSRINEFCQNFSTVQTSCVISDPIKIDLKNKLKEQNVELTFEELGLWIREYNNQNFENVKLYNSDIDRYKLNVLSITIIPSEFTVFPSNFRGQIWIVLSDTFEYTIHSNKNLKSCSIEGELGWSCQVNNSAARISYKIQTYPPDWGFKTIIAKAMYNDIDGNVVYQDIDIKAINLFYKPEKFPIPLYAIIIIVIILMALIGYILWKVGKRKWKRKSIS